MFANPTLELTATESRRGRPGAFAGGMEVAEVLRVCLEELRFSLSLEVEDFNGFMGSGEVYSELTPVGTSTRGVPRSCLAI